MGWMMYYRDSKVETGFQIMALKIATGQCHPAWLFWILRNPGGVIAPKPNLTFFHLQAMLNIDHVDIFCWLVKKRLLRKVPKRLLHFDTLSDHGWIRQLGPILRNRLNQQAPDSVIQ